MQMVRKFLSFSLLICLFAASPMSASAHIPVTALSGQDGTPTLAPLLKKVTPAVVNIAVQGHVATQSNPLFADPFFRQFFNVPNMPRERKFKAAGSGVIVDAKHGYVLTNNHVIRHADKVSVALKDGRTFKAKVIGADADADIAVIQIPAKNLTALPMGDSSDLQVGDFVIAVGNPFALGQTVTSGIVSALGRTGLGIEGYEDFIQTDASINPGNSGGALVDLHGKLIGINTAIVAPSGGNVGIGFAIPINMAHSIMQQLIKHGKVVRGFLGISIQNMSSDVAKAMGTSADQGAIVSQVEDGSAAAKAGLKPGDVIVSLDGKQVKNASELRNSVALLQPGHSVSLGIIRNGRPMNVTAVLGTRHEQQVTAKNVDPRLAGATFTTVKKGLPLFRHAEGVGIASVQKGSPAWRAGLRKGDVITAVNRKPVKKPGDLARIAKKSPNVLILNIQRGNANLLLVLR